MCDVNGEYWDRVMAPILDEITRGVWKLHFYWEEVDNLEVILIDQHSFWWYSLSSYLSLHWSRSDPASFRKWILFTINAVSNTRKIKHNSIVFPTIFAANFPHAHAYHQDLSSQSLDSFQLFVIIEKRTLSSMNLDAPLAYGHASMRHHHQMTLLAQRTTNYCGSSRFGIDWTCTRQTAALWRVTWFCDDWRDIQRAHVSQPIACNAFMRLIAPPSWKMARAKTLSVANDFSLFERFVEIFVDEHKNCAVIVATLTETTPPRKSIRTKSKKKNERKKTTSRCNAALSWMLSTKKERKNWNKLHFHWIRFVRCEREIQFSEMPNVILFFCSFCCCMHVCVFGCKNGVKVQTLRQRGHNKRHKR